MQKLAVIALLFTASLSAQSFDAFFKPSDSLNKPRRNAVVIGTAAATTGSLVALNQLWYSDYQKTGFHTKNDNAEWLQMDKAGHVFASYQLSRVGYDLFAWSGVQEKHRIWYGSTIGLAYMTAIEIMDGHSAEWGASWGDMAANVGGTALFVSQQLLWKEQRIIPKFSFHTTPYPSARPDALGESVTEQVFKDYNGQTYWLSANVRSFWKSAPVPEWFNIAVGYGAEGMITGDDDLVNMIFLPENERFRQYYLSVDIDLTRIKTNSHFLKSVFSVINTLKVPAPAIEITGRGVVKGHLIYF